MATPVHALCFLIMEHVAKYKFTEAVWAVLSSMGHSLFTLQFTLENLMLDMQLQHNPAHTFLWHARHMFPSVAVKCERFHSFTIAALDNYLRVVLINYRVKIRMSSFIWRYCGIMESVEQNCHKHVDVSPCELTVKPGGYVSFHSVLCLSIKAVVSEHVSRIIARERK